MRLLLFWSLVLSGALALFNVVMSRARWLALAAFVLIGLSLALGGHKVPVNDFADDTPYIGLDWFILDLLGSTLIFVFIEKLFALRKDQPVFRPEWQTDFHHFLVNHMIVGFVLLATNLLVHKLFGWAAKDGIRAWVQDLPFLVALFLIVLVADLVQYWTHRAYHEVPALWRLHAVHHSVKSMDWLAGSRQHILELIITRTLVLAPIFVLGFSKEVIDAYIVIVGFQAVFNHANVSVRLGPLRYVIVTPNFHHWHHSADDEGIDRNYAAHFAFIDYAFGTAAQGRPRLARRLRRGRRLRAERLLQAARLSVRLEGLSARFAGVRVRRRHRRRRRRRPALRGDRRPARLLGAPARPRREGRREDPHLGRRPLQLHQPRRRRRRTSTRRTPTSAARRWPATRRATSSTWSSATASPGTRSTRASCSATARAPQIIAMLLAECDGRRRRSAGSRARSTAVRVGAGGFELDTDARRRSRRRGSSSRPAASRSRRSAPATGATSWPASSATGIVETAPGAGAASSAPAPTGSRFAALAGVALPVRDRGRRGARRAPIRRRPALHPPRPERPGGAADLDLLAPGRGRSRSTSRPGIDLAPALLDGQGGAGAGSARVARRAAAAPPRRGLAAPARRRSRDRPLADLRDRDLAALAAGLHALGADAGRHRGLPQGRGHRRRRRHPRARLAQLRKPAASRACTSSARSST